jgi:hypothetical protein
MIDLNKKTGNYYSVEVEYKDNATQGKWVTREYRGQSYGQTVSEFLQNAGFSSRDESLEYNVKKVRMFDSLKEYMDASVDDFEAYDKKMSRINQAEQRFGYEDDASDDKEFE